jgi:hypothetical protein
LFAGGDTNLYGYVLGDPVNWIDPLGLAAYGVCLAREYINKYGNPETAWEAVYRDRVKEGMSLEELKNAEHYLYAYYMVEDNSYNWGLFYALTWGYHEYKFWINAGYKARYYLNEMFGFEDSTPISPFAHTPPTFDEFLSGIQGSNDALNEIFSPSYEECECSN